MLLSFRPGIACLFTFWLVALVGFCSAQDGNPNDVSDDSQARARRALEHMKSFELRLAGASEGAKGPDAKEAAKPAEAKDEAKDVVALLDRPLLAFGDSARSNENGTLWAFGKTGRPAAFLELYQPQDRGNWVHAVTLTGQQRAVMTTPVRTRWAPEKTQIEPALLPNAAAPHAREGTRTRQLKELARRFTAHEFWDPDNSRFQLRLLVQPVHRYSDAKAGLHDGAAFILAHGTNPEVILLIEAQGEKLEAARWNYSLARLGSAELHVELDGKEVWKRDRTPGVVGKSSDPYWLFLSPVEAEE